MVKVTGLSVPDPLLTAYFRTMTSKTSFGVDNVGLKLPGQNWTRARRTSARSLFLIFQSTWDTFLSTRRDAWQAYWISLGHSFELTPAGWPGSGYSAFVEVNAPRYKLGEDLLLDPPGLGDDIIINGNFATDTDWFYYFPGEIVDGHFHFLQGDSAYDQLVQSYDSLPLAARYRLELDLIAPGTDGNINLAIITDDEDDDIEAEIDPSATGHVGCDISTSVAVGTLLEEIVITMGFSSTPGDWYVTNVTLRPYL